MAFRTYVPRVIVLGLLVALVATTPACSRDSQAGHGGNGLGGEGGAGGTGAVGGGGSQGGAGGTGADGGSGGAAGTGGAAGAAGAGGEGGTCLVDGLDECELVDYGLLVWLPQLAPVVAYGTGVPMFELPGVVVSHDLEGQPGTLAVEGLDGVRVTLEYVAGPGMAPPVVLGDEVILHYDAFYDGIAERQAHRQMLWLRDGSGRDLWAMDVHQNSGFPAQILGVSASRSQPRCARTLDTGSGAARYGGSDLTIRYRGGPETFAPLGDVTPVSGAGVTGRLLVAESFDRPAECLDDAFARSSMKLSFLVTDRGPKGTGCVLDGDCDDETYCERGAGRCDGAGTCVPRPSYCRRSLPVCACDGRIYEGTCAANRAGVDVACDGPGCPSHATCGTFACVDGEEACVRNWLGAIPQCAPLCAAKDCSCFAGAGWAGCSCAQTAPGRIEVSCE